MRQTQTLAAQFGFIYLPKIITFPLLKGHYAYIFLWVNANNLLYLGYPGSYHLSWHAVKKKEEYVCFKKVKPLKSLGKSYSNLTDFNSLISK